MPGADIWLKDPVSIGESHVSFSTVYDSDWRSNLLVNGGLFLEPTAPSTILHLISSKTSSNEILGKNSGALGVSWRKSSAQLSVSGDFLSVSLRSDGFVQEPNLRLVQNKSPEEINNVATKRGEIIRERQGGAVNTTKHLWAGAIAAMVSR